MAHWDDSGTAVGYEGKKGDKLIAKSLREIGRAHV